MPSIHRTTGVLIIAAMIAAVFFLSIPGISLWQKVVQDAGHGPVFAVIGIVLALMRESGGDSSVRTTPMLLQAFAFAVAIGVATELIQYFQPGRSVSLVDVFHDAAGAALGLSLLAIIERSGPSPGVPPTSPIHMGEVAIALAAFTILAWQPLQCAIGYANRNAAFPTLAQGTRAADLYFVRAHDGSLARRQLPAPWALSGEGRALQLRFASGARPALELFEPVQDWRGFNVVAFDLTNPGAEPLELTLRILDARHDWTNDDRLNLPLTIPPGVRMTVRVSLAAVESAPARRRMDLTRIANVMLFSRRPATGIEFYLSRAWLE